MNAPVSQEAAWAYGRPPAKAVLRAQAEDFEVEELPSVTPSGEGEHLWLCARKVGRSTSELAGALARHWGISRRDVGFAGRKDRHADARQWFSVRLPGRHDDTPPELPGVTWVAARRHARKLATGALRGNRFRLTLREIEGDATELESRLEQIRTLGVPNYFGPQRFGRRGDNLAAAWRLLVEGVPERRRDLRGLLYSAARSWCFNRVASLRVADGSWQRLLPGELVALEGSRSVFAIEAPDATLLQRLAAFDIHPSGPLPGRAQQLPSADCAVLELGALAALAPLISGLAEARVEAARRPLRLRPVAMQWQWLDQGTLELSFELPAGSYATSVVRELCDARDASGADLHVPA